MFDWVASDLPGCGELRPRVFTDPRGRFVKTFHRPLFSDLGLPVDWAEEYYSVSSRGVLRGLHFQTPPHDHAKLVYCTAGAVLDAVVDLRVGSPTYGAHALFRLDAATANMVFLPPGLAHGFLTLSETATVLYKVTSVYAPQHDAGILWNSAGISWPETQPVLSERDTAFPRLATFASPFVYAPSAP